MIWILDPEQPGESRGTMSAIGPFVSVIAAEEYLRKDARGSFGTGETRREVRV